MEIFDGAKLLKAAELGEPKPQVVMHPDFFIKLGMTLDSFEGQEHVRNQCKHLKRGKTWSEQCGRPMSSITKCRTEVREMRDGEPALTLA